MNDNIVSIPTNLNDSNNNEPTEKNVITSMLCSNQSITLNSNSDSIMDSLINTSTKKWSCLHPGCKKTYNWKRNMLQHLNEKHVNHVSIPCSANCGKFFSSKSLMHKHMKYMHYNNEKLESLIKKKKLEFDKYYSNVDFNNTNPMVTDSSKIVSIWDTFDEKVQENLPFDPCKSNKNYKCPKCDIILTRKSNLSIHLLRFHSQPRSYPCEYTNCDKSFDYKHVLKRHVDKIHKVNEANL